MNQVRKYYNPNFLRDHLCGNAIMSVSYSGAIAVVEIAKWGNELWQRVQYGFTARELPEEIVTQVYTAGTVDL